MANQKKILTSGAAVVAAVGVLFGGTFAWQSISQQALNEVAASVNPGGRLHDDFNDITEDLKAQVTANEDGTTPLVTMSYDKNVYVENFTEYAENGAQVYARVRLDEYMELGQNAGKLNAQGKKDESNTAKSVVAGAELDDKTTWTTHVLGQEDEETDPFHQYWKWELGGESVTYLPTFNRNKDSLEADINGSFAKGFTDYVDYSKEENASRDGVAIYDADAAADGNEVDELGDTLKAVNVPLSDVIYAGSKDKAEGILKKYNGQLLNENAPNVRLEEETHEVRDTLSFDSEDAQIISMAEYFEMLDADEDWDGIGHYWVYDEDGWAYWAAPIDPETATAPLLNGIQRTEKIINQDWYYAINVVAQFITYEDMGYDDGTGFYDISEGDGPSGNALKLLKTIGVEVPENEAANAEELAAALAQGGIITVTDDIDLTEQLTVSASCVLKLGENTISTENAGDVTHSDADKVWSFLSVRNGATLVIEADEDGGVTVPYHENGCYAIDVRGGSRLVINGGDFAGIAHTIYVYEGEAVINGGTFVLTDIDDWAAEGKNFTLNCYNVNYQNGTAKITVCGGTFEGFDPAHPKTDDAVSYVPAGYRSTETAEGSGTYTVAKIETAAGV